PASIKATGPQACLRSATRLTRSGVRNLLAFPCRRAEPRHPTNTLAIALGCPWRWPRAGVHLQTQALEGLESCRRPRRRLMRQPKRQLQTRSRHRLTISAVPLTCSIRRRALRLSSLIDSVDRILSVKGTLRSEAQASGIEHGRVLGGIRAAAVLLASGCIASNNS